MAGGRYSQSLDIGKELENEELARPEIPAAGPSKGPPAGEEPPAKPEEQPEKEIPAPAEDSEEEFVDESGPPDPLEEEVLEIIGNDAPSKKQAVGVFERLEKFRFALGVLLFLGIGSWLVLSILSAPEEQAVAQPAAEPELFFEAPEIAPVEPPVMEETAKSVDELPDIFAEGLKD